LRNASDTTLYFFDYTEVRWQRAFARPAINRLEVDSGEASPATRRPRSHLMTRCRSTIGALALCALGVCAFGASSAVAAKPHWYTCKNVGVPLGTFTSSTCSGPRFTEQAWETVKAPKKTRIDVTSTKRKKGEEEEVLPNELKATIAGIKFEITCGAMKSGDEAETKEGGKETVIDENEEEAAIIGGGFFKYTECAVANPEPTKCKVKGGGFTTVNLTGTTSMASEAEEAVSLIKIGPESGTTIATITIEGCGTPGFNGAKALTGSTTGEVPAEAKSATVYEGTVGGELKLGGQQAELFQRTHTVMWGTQNAVGLETP
jgi:hypothetical protein